MVDAFKKHIEGGTRTRKLPQRYQQAGPVMPSTHKEINVLIRSKLSLLTTADIEQLGGAAALTDESHELRKMKMPDKKELVQRIIPEFAVQIAAARQLAEERAAALTGERVEAEESDGSSDRGDVMQTEEDTAATDEEMMREAMAAARAATRCT